MPSTNVVYTAGIEFGNIRRTALDGDATPRAGSPWSFCRFQHRGFGDVAVANPVTPELVTAYWFCQRKAFLLLRGDKGDAAHGYVTGTALEATRSVESYLDFCKRSGLAIDQSDNAGLDGGKHDVIVAATLKVDGLKPKLIF